MGDHESGFNQIGQPGDDLSILAQFEDADRMLRARRGGDIDQESPAEFDAEEAQDQAAKVAGWLLAHRLGVSAEWLALLLTLDQIDITQLKIPATDTAGLFEIPLQDVPGDNADFADYETDPDDSLDAEDHGGEDTVADEVPIDPYDRLPPLDKEADDVYPDEPDVEPAVPYIIGGEDGLDPDRLPFYFKKPVPAGGRISRKTRKAAKTIVGLPERPPDRYIRPARMGLDVIATPGKFAIAGAAVLLIATTVAGYRFLSGFTHHDTLPVATASPTHNKQTGTAHDEQCYHMIGNIEWHCGMWVLDTLTDKNHIRVQPPHAHEFYQVQLATPTNIGKYVLVVDETRDGLTVTSVTINARRNKS